MLSFYSTKNKHITVNSIRQAVMQGLSSDSGLFMPSEIFPFDQTLLDKIETLSFAEIAEQLLFPYFRNEIPVNAFRKIIESTFSFPAPLVSLNEKINILELFHGPTLAFKDFGAGFMAGVMSFFQSDSEKELTILTATSGDTGAAVASAFHNKPGIKVVILYPNGKVSPFQENQITSFGNNIYPIALNGTFDDCQSLVKKAFFDKEITEKLSLNSANSINISRLLPQSVYYFEGYKQLKDKSEPPVFCVPSGNFGNISAGIFAWRSGLPVKKFIAATNANRTFLNYLETGEYYPQKSIATYSNAMDVGDPSNFHRLVDLYGSTWNIVKNNVESFSVTDNEVMKTIEQTWRDHKYLADPHTAVALASAHKYNQDHDNNIICLSTAHPDKFSEVLNLIPGIEKNTVPEKIEVLRKNHTFLDNNFSLFSNYLLSL